MAILQIGWCPKMRVFLAHSESCGLSARGIEEGPYYEYWVIPRDRAVTLCEVLHKEGASLVWLGILEPP